jgi:hypothetical protein
MTDHCHGNDKDKVENDITRNSDPLPCLLCKPSSPARGEGKTRQTATAISVSGLPRRQNALAMTDHCHGNDKDKVENDIIRNSDPSP